MFLFVKGRVVYVVRFGCRFFTLLSDLLTDGYLLIPFLVAGGLVQVGGRVVFLPFSLLLSSIGIVAV